MIHPIDSQLENRQVLYSKIEKDINCYGFCLSTCPPERDFLEWLKYDKGFSWQGAINVDIVDYEDLGTIWRIMISSDPQTDTVDRLE
jgi:hypothetical protein